MILKLNDFNALVFCIMSIQAATVHIHVNVRVHVRVSVGVSVHASGTEERFGEREKGKS